MEEPELLNVISNGLLAHHDAALLVIAISFRSCFHWSGKTLIAYRRNQLAITHKSGTT